MAHPAPPPKSATVPAATRTEDNVRRARSKLSRETPQNFFFYLILLLVLIRRDNVMRHRFVCRGRTTSPCCNCIVRLTLTSE